MSATLIIILVVVAAYLAAHVAFEWLVHRFLIISGAEYLLLGILLGPEVTGLISASVVDDFASVMTLALGWMGMVVGAEFLLPELLRFRAVYYRIAFLAAVATLTLVAGVMTLALMSLFDMTAVGAVIPAVAMGIVATASAPSGVMAVTRHLRWRGPIVDQLTIAAAVHGFVAIAAAGLLLSVARAGADMAATPSPVEWMVISVAIGVVGGALFHLFLGDEQNFDRLVVALSGAIILTTGAAAYLRLSPLLPTFLVGAILINTSPVRAQIKHVLSQVERPFYFVLLIFAGAAWRPEQQAWLVPVSLFLVTQAAGAIGGARLATRLSDMLPTLGADWGRAMLGHGELALAIGLNYQLHDGATLPNLVFTATVASVLLTHLTSARLVRSVVRPDLDMQLASAEDAAAHDPTPHPDR